MPSAIDCALDAIDGVAADGDLDAGRLDDVPFDLDCAADPIRLPDGKVIYPPLLHGEPVHEIACRLLDMQDPARSRYLRLVGPPGTGKSQIARAIAFELWRRRGHPVIERHGAPFYGLVEINGGPSSDEFFFRYDYVPVKDGTGEVKLVDAAFVEAMRHGWVVMIDEANTIRDVALLSLNATLDGRLTLYLPATGESVVAQPGFAVLIAYNPGLVGASDIPDAWRSRFPATLEVTSNWAAMTRMGVPTALVAQARALDQRRFNADDGLVWTPQFRDIEALADMMVRLGERTAIAFFVSNLLEQVQAGVIQSAEAAAACRMLDQAGYGIYKIPATSKAPSFEGFARAVTG